MIDEQLKKIALHYGLDKQLEKTVEELAELIVAIKHFKFRQSGDSLANLIEELGDAGIMIDQIKFLLEESACKSAIEESIEYKIARELKRIEAQNAKKQEA